MSTPKRPMPVGPIPLDYQQAESTRMERWRAIASVTKWLAGLSVCAAMGLAIMPHLTRTPGCDPRGKCSSNLKCIAAACIVYANTHQGHYPGSMAELLSSSGMTSAVVICPSSSDAPAAGTQAQQISAFSLPGHCSYIYLGKGLTSDSPSETVLAYEPLSNHGNSGMNVLFNDYHVQWMAAAEANKLIGSIVLGKPTVWPPPKTTGG